MKLANPTKAFIALVGLICLTVLRFGNKLDEAAFTGLGGMILGYAVGNGVYGSGGGGGGASRNGNNSGAGGTGGNGWVRIICQ